MAGDCRFVNGLLQNVSKYIRGGAADATKCSGTSKTLVEQITTISYSVKVRSSAFYTALTTVF